MRKSTPNKNRVKEGRTYFNIEEYEYIVKMFPRKDRGEAWLILKHFSEDGILFNPPSKSYPLDKHLYWCVKRRLSDTYFKETYGEHRRSIEKRGRRKLYFTNKDLREKIDHPIDLIELKDEVRKLYEKVDKLPMRYNLGDARRENLKMLDLLLQGKTLRDIAAILGRAENTLQYRLGHIRKHLL